MSYDPNYPANNSPATAAGMRAQLNGMKLLLEAGNVPVGCVLAYLKNLPNSPALPATWAECNGQVLSDAESPLDGVTLPDLNGALGGAPSFLRGATASGGTGGGESHTHGVDLNVNGGSTQMGADFVVVPPGGYNTDPASSLPPFYEVVWVMRVK